MSTLASSNLQVNPDVREASLLRAWYDQNGQQTAFTSISEGRGGGGGGAGSDELRTIASVKDENIGKGANGKVRVLRGKRGGLETDE